MESLNENSFEVTLENEYLGSSFKTLALIENGWYQDGNGFFYSRRSSAKTDSPRLYLADNTAMARAYLQLYRATSNKIFLLKGVNLGHLINQHFYNQVASFNLAEDEGTPLICSPLFKSTSQFLLQGCLLTYIKLAVT